MRLLLFLFFIFLAASDLKSQVEIIDVEKGLSNRNVTCILQTRNGYIWFGTVNGLNRYDGYGIKEYGYSIGDSNSLSNGHINCLLEDSAGNLWIGTKNGLNILDQKTDRIKVIYTRDSMRNNKQLKNISINCIVENHGDRLLATGDGRILKVAGDGKIHELFSLPSQGYFSQGGITCITPDIAGALWITFDGKYMFKLFSDGSRDTTIQTLWLNRVRDLLIPPQLNNAGIVIGNANEVYKFNISTGEKLNDHLLDSLNKVHHFPEVLMQSPDGDIWISYENGDMIKIDINSWKVFNYSSTVKPYCAGVPRALYQDNMDIMWIGTTYNIIKYCPRDNLFENYLAKPSFENQTLKNSLRGIIEDDKGDIYIGGYSGLFRFRPKEKSFKRFKMIDYNNKADNNYHPFRLLNDTNGFIWIGSEGHGFYRFNKKNEKFEFPVHKNLAEQKKVRITFDLIEEEGKIILGTINGLLFYDKRTHHLEQYANANDRYDISNVEIMDLARSNKNEIWIGSHNTGLYKLEKDKGITEYYSTSTHPALSHNSITNLYVDKKGILWIGTRGGGLNKLDPQTKTIEHYSEKNGLPDNIIAGITEDKTGMLWVSTFNGLSKFNPVTKQFYNYFEKDGLSDNEFNVAAHLMTSEGKLYLGGINGMNAFFPEEIEEKKRKSSVLYLTRFIQDDADVQNNIDVSGDLSDLKNIYVSKENRFISFYFSLADYYNPSANKFFYKLEGYDSDWNSLGTQNNIRFNRLSPGNYVLKIKAISSEGIAALNELSFEICVCLPFYAQSWFIVLMVILCIIIMYFIVRFSISYVKH